MGQQNQEEDKIQETDANVETAIEIPNQYEEIPQEENIIKKKQKYRYPHANGGGFAETYNINEVPMDARPKIKYPLQAGGYMRVPIGVCGFTPKESEEAEKN